MNVNMGMIDRGLRLVVALVLLYLALARRRWAAACCTGSPCSSRWCSG